MAADRAPFIDQTQSMNLWLSTPTFGKVNSMHMYAWKKGLKTGMYYLRSRSAVDAVKVTVSSEKTAKEDFIKSQIMNQGRIHYLLLHTHLLNASKCHTPPPGLMALFLLNCLMSQSHTGSHNFAR